MASFSGSRRHAGRAENEIRIVSANLRGFHTNVGELTHRFIRANNADVVFVCETFLDSSVPTNYARIKGYSAWVRKDRSTQGGGVAFCYKASLNAVVLDTPIPAGLEAVMLKLVGADGRGVLCVGCYRPPSQGTALLDYITTNLDRLMTVHRCDNVVIIGDLNPRGIQRTFDSLLTVFNLHNHVTFPTHRSGSILDPVVTDLPPHEVSCSPLGPVGSSDHEAILTRITFRRTRDESSTRTLWQWENANWEQLRRCLATANWASLLQGDVDQQAVRLTEVLLGAQERWVPHKQHRVRSSDQPWFGPQCRAASDNKYRLWRIYKRNPTRRNKDRHKEAAAQMEATQTWAREQWVESKKRKLRGGHIGSKQWWDLVKDTQGKDTTSTIPPLLKDSGELLMNNKDKVDFLAQHFARKMTVPHPTKLPPSLPVVAGERLTSVTTTEGEVRAALSALEENKAVGPDGVSPRLLRRCSGVLAHPLSRLFEAILRQERWPRIWKTSHVVPVHKKGSRSEAANYRPISLLSVVGKVLEDILTRRLTSHLETQHLLSARQFGFRKARSAADLTLLLSNEWSDALDQGRPTAVLALDIAGAFDRVWHAGLVERLHAAGVGGALLELLRDYLQEREMRVVHNGQQSSPVKIGAGVPQGSVLGPLLWNVYVNDMLNLVPSARAYADDVTISLPFSPGEEQVVTARLNTTLRRLEDWGRRWQVTFAPQKTQLLVVSRLTHDIRPILNEVQLAPQQELQILGVTFDSKLTYQAHITQLARSAAGKLACLRRMSGLLDSKGRELLYKAEIRSSLEFSCLAWGGAAPSHLAVLDKIQRRAERLIEDGLPEQRAGLHSLQHRRDVAGLATLYKVQEQRTPHLQELRLPPRRAEVLTRAVSAAPTALATPRSHSTHHQRQFRQKYGQWWNEFLASDKCPDDLSVAVCGGQKFKVLVNQWFSEMRDSDTGVHSRGSASQVTVTR